MLHSPLLCTCGSAGCWLVIGVIAVVRVICTRREGAERKQEREERRWRRVGRTTHPISLPHRHSLPPGYCQHLIDAGIIKPAGDPT